MSFIIDSNIPLHNTSKLNNLNQMKGHSFISWLILTLTILITSNHSHAKHTHPISQILKFDKFFFTNHQWMIHQTQSIETQLELSAPTLVAGLLCFMAASISSAGGIGGGGLFVPILTIVAGLDLKTASAFSAFMVAGGTLANVLCNLFIINPKYGGKTLIDYDIVLLSEPCLLLGVSIGVICNLVFPEWLITILFAIFLGWSTFKTCKNGVLYWNLESEEVRRNEFVALEHGPVRSGEGVGDKSTKELERESKSEISWKKLGFLFMVWCSFSLLYLVRRSRSGQSTTFIAVCGVGYWVLSSFQIPLAIVFTAWILHTRDSLQVQASNNQEIGNEIRGPPLNVLVFPVMALLAGILGGVFGMGGGMLISPLLLQVGIVPEVTAATCSFMVFFASSMSAFQYFMLGMEHTSIALIFAITCFVASAIGLLVVQRAIHDYGRASLIVFSVSTVMALSTVLITSFGALDVWRDYTDGKYMGFKLPC